MRIVLRQMVRRWWRVCGVLALVSLLASTFIVPLLPMGRISDGVAGADQEAVCHVRVFRTYRRFRFDEALSAEARAGLDTFGATLKTLEYRRDDQLSIQTGCESYECWQRGTDAMWYSEEWGFPLRCVAGWRFVTMDAKEKASSGLIELPAAFALTNDCPSGIPIRFRFLSVGANAVVHAAAWGVVIGFADVVRRGRRMRRGECPECCYELGGELASGCAECGWRR